MKLFIFSCCLMVSQVSSSQNDFTEADAKQLIDIFFEGFHESDTLKKKSVLISNLNIQTVFSNQNGKNYIHESNITEFLKAIATRPEGQKWDEKLLCYTVQIDGNLAHVWTPY